MVADKLDLLLVLHTTGALEENGWSTKLPWENVASDAKSSLLMAKIDFSHVEQINSSTTDHLVSSIDV